MKNLIDLYPLIEEGFTDPIDQHAIKLVLLAEEVARFETRFVPRSELNTLKLEMTIRFGIMVSVAVGILATLVKLL